MKQSKRLTDCTPEIACIIKEDQMGGEMKQSLQAELARNWHNAMTHEKKKVGRGLSLAVDL